MSSKASLSSVDFEKLRKLDTCTASNAIERLNVRLRNEGFAWNEVRCQFPALTPMLGYVVPGKIRSSSAPATGGCYYDRMDFWNYVTTIPEPRVIVMQDVDRFPGFGALVGEIHASIGLKLKCVGYVTNGAVRDLGAVEALGFHLFSGNVAVSHAYAHIVDFGAPIEIGGLKMRPGDLIHGDRHGIHKIPLEVAAELPAVAEQILTEEHEMIQFCRSSRFSLKGLSEKLHQMEKHCQPGTTRS